MFLFSPLGSFPAHTCLWVFQVSDIIDDTVFCLNIIPIAGRFEKLSGIWEIRLKDATEQSENNPWQRLGKCSNVIKFCLKGNTIETALTSCFLINVEFLLKTLCLCIYICSPLARILGEEGRAFRPLESSFMTLLLSFWFRRIDVNIYW